MILNTTHFQSPDTLCLQGQSVCLTQTEINISVALDTSHRTTL